MTVKRIYYANDPRLRQKAKLVKQFGPELKTLADDMLETMKVGNGVGLAAPQVGLLQRILVAELPADEDIPHSGKPFVLVNPQIVDSSHQEVDGVEGCLSVPNWFGRVWRPEWVVIKAKTVHGKPTRIKAEDYLARVFLHEMDHLDGILFIDRVESPDDLWQQTPEEAEELAKSNQEKLMV